MKNLIESWMKNHHKTLRKFSSKTRRTFTEILIKSWMKSCHKTLRKIITKILKKFSSRIRKRFEKSRVKTSIFCEVSKLLREGNFRLSWEIKKFLREGNFPKYKLHRERELGRFIVLTEIDDENIVHIQYKKNDVELEKSCDKAEVSCG